MKRTHMFRISLVVCFALLNLGLMGPAITGTGPVTDPISGLSADVQTPASSNHSAAATASALWTKYAGNPVLKPELSPRTWDYGGVVLPSVLRRDGSYMLWYSANDRPYTVYRVGLAVSPDGVNWIKSPDNPVMSVGASGAWDSAYVLAPQVIYHDGMYKMWYRGTDDYLYSVGASLGYATSLDGVDWVKYEDNPVLTVGLPGSWDDKSLWSASVMVEGSTYKMWYSGCNATNCRIGMAVSPDGVHWMKYAGNPVLDVGSPGGWDGTFAYYPTVLFNGFAYEMWYSGVSSNYTYAVGHATSPDGVNWTKDPGNPVLSTGAAGSWDDHEVLAPSVALQDDIDKMWYTGLHDTPVNRIGYASSPFSVERVYFPIILR